MVKNAAQFGLGMMVWWVVGFAFAFGDPDGGFLGTKYWAGDEWRGSQLGAEAAIVGLIGISVVYIINGTIAERTQLIPYLLFTFFVMIFAWPVVVSWSWGGGWQDKMAIAFEDIGGVAVVHIFAGSFALVSALVLDKRAGRWIPDSQVPAFTYNSPPLLAIGTLLYFIHLCFLNAYRADTLIARGRAVFNTWLCAGTTALTTTLLGTFSNKSVENHFATVLRGFIGGAVLISGVAWNVDGWAAFTFGVFGGLVLVASLFLVEYFHIDDVTQSISVHFTMGLMGCFGVGLWDNSRGGFHDNDGELIGSQLGSELAITAWSSIWAVALFGLCKFLKVLRVPETVQAQGYNSSVLTLKGFEAVGRQVLPNRDTQSLEQSAKPNETELAGRLHETTMPRADS